MATIQDIATAEDVTAVYVGRVLKLAYPAPAVLEKLLIARALPALSIKDLAMIAEQPWGEQNLAAFD